MTLSIKLQAQHASLDAKRKDALAAYYAPKVAATEKNVAVDSGFQRAPRRVQAVLLSTSPRIYRALDKALGRGVDAPGLVASSHSVAARMGAAICAGGRLAGGAISLGVKFLLLGATHLWSFLTMGCALPAAKPRVVFISPPAFAEDLSKRLEENLRSMLSEKREAAHPSLVAEYARDAVERPQPMFFNGVPTLAHKGYGRDDPRIDKAYAEATEQLATALGPLAEETYTASCLLNQSVFGCIMSAAAWQTPEDSPYHFSLLQKHQSYTYSLVTNAEQKTAAVRLELKLTHGYVVDCADCEPLDAPVRIIATVPLGESSRPSVQLLGEGFLPYVGGSFAA